MSESFFSCLHSSCVRYPMLVPSEQIGKPLDISLHVEWWHEEKDHGLKIRLFVQKCHINMANTINGADVLEKFKNWSLLVAKNQTLYGTFQLSKIQDKEYDVVMFGGDLKN